MYTVNSFQENSTLFKKFLLFGVRNFNSASSARRRSLIALCDGGIKIPHSASYKNQVNNAIVCWFFSRRIRRNDEILGYIRCARIISTAQLL